MGDDPGKKTHRGFGEPNERTTVVDGLPAAEGPAAEHEVRPDAARGPIEIELAHETGTPTLLAGPWRAVEIWTSNHIYGLDAHLVCREVLDRGVGRVNPEHKTLGATLVGGQRRSPGGAIEEVSHPFPTPGSSAVFTRAMGTRLSYSETSAVTRVVLRQRVVRVKRGTIPPSWDEVTGPGR